MQVSMHNIHTTVWVLFGVLIALTEAQYSFPIQPIFNYRLRNGSSIPLPSNFNADAVFVTGLVQRSEAIENYPFDPYYQPITPQGAPNNTVLATLTFIHYTSTDAGPYNELALIFPVMPASMAQRFQHPYPLPNDPTYAQDYSISMALWLDSRLGIEFGREIWGYPKTQSRIDYSAVESGGNSMFHFSVQDLRTRRKIASLDLTHPAVTNMDSIWKSSFGITPVNTGMTSFDANNGKVNPYLMQTGPFFTAPWSAVAANSVLDIEDSVLEDLAFTPLQFWRGKNVNLAIGFPVNFSPVTVQ